MEEKIEKLKCKALAFQRMLEKYAPEELDATLLLRWLDPLFEGVRSGLIVPPTYYKFRLALGKDNDFFEDKIDLRFAEAEFIAALEDWESQDWYKQLKND